MTARRQVTVFGLGEAGSLIAADLAESDVDVHAYDPAPVPTPPGVIRYGEPGSAVVGSDIVVALTTAVDATRALTQALGEIQSETVYADLSTGSPKLKRDLAELAASHELTFVDVALMGTVPGNGLRTPALASGPGAVPFAGFINNLGGHVEAIGDTPGDAAARKLLRSVVTKGLTALLMESLEAAEEHNDREWLWQHVVELISDADQKLLVRFIEGTSKHVDRRIVEMEAARDFIESLGAPAPMTTATVETLWRIRSEGKASA